VVGEVTVGASLSLTGRYALQGRQAEAGLRLWAAETNARGGLPLGPAGRRAIRLAVHDDGSRAAGLETNLARLLDGDGVHVLFGPYGSDLALRAVRLAAARDRVLWNHAGASDAVAAAAPQAIIAGIAPASAYFAALPAFLRRVDPEVDRLAILYDGAGSFGCHVASGAAGAARQAGLGQVATFPFTPPLADRPEVLAAVRAWRPRAVSCAGRFQDDVWLAARRDCLGPECCAFAAVAAGLGAFGAAAGSDSEGVVGPSHWEPPTPAAQDAWPAVSGFAAHYACVYGGPPEYPAALAYAMGTVLAACAARAEALDDRALRRVALGADLPTILGRFRLDPVTGRQVGYRPVVVEWRGGRKRVVAPAP
jgi:ABC-type branched-subunit amino acid transport system substrate-binding protein